MQFMLAERLGVADVDGLADSLTKEQWQEWMTYAVVVGWFDTVREPEQKLTPDQSKQVFAGMFG